MPDKITIDGNILIVTPGQEWTNHQVLASRARVSRIVEGNGIKRILIDVRKSGVRMSTVEIFDLHDLHQHEFSKDTKHALLYSPANIARADVQFAENVAVNRGIYLKVFTDIESAKRWLQEDMGA
jgi:hypothetical protein